MWVKVCGLTREEDVDAALLAGADAVGFVLAESPRRVTLDRARELAARAAGMAMTVAVDVDPSDRDVARLDGFDAVQVHGACGALPKGMRVLRAIGPADDPPDGADFILVDGSRGKGVPADWAALASRTWPAPLVLAGGLSAGNVCAAIIAVRPFGVDVSSGVESAPGVKDPALVREFVARARSA